MTNIAVQIRAVISMANYFGVDVQELRQPTEMVQEAVHSHQRTVLVDSIQHERRRAQVRERIRDQQRGWRHDQSS